VVVVEEGIVAFLFANGGGGTMTGIKACVIEEHQKFLSYGIV
jgi:hypothetical protein